MQNGLHIGAAKRVLRAALRARRRELTPAEHDALSSAVCRRVIAHPLWLAAHTIVAYAATREEVGTRLVLDGALTAGKTLVLPAVTAAGIAWRVVNDPATELVAGAYGIAEPAATAPPWDPARSLQPVLWLVPGVGFDRGGNRLGRGGGHYDQALRAAAARQGTVGIAFPCQVVPAIPVAEGDWPVEAVATADEWIAAEDQQERTTVNILT